MSKNNKILSEETCEACRDGAIKLSNIESKILLKEIPLWTIEVLQDIPQLTRTFKFDNFQEALKFSNKVGELAESVGHHPAILIEWGKVVVTWWSHKIEGLHKNDFIMAARTDESFKG